MITITGYINGIKHQRVFAEMGTASEVFEKLKQRDDISDLSYNR